MQEVLLGDRVVDLLDPVERQLLQAVYFDVVYFGCPTQSLAPLALLDELYNPPEADLSRLGTRNMLTCFFPLHI